MTFNKFEDMEAWKLARILTRDIYASFGACRDYGFKDQIQRAAVSVMNNIAEGFDRNGCKEFMYFLRIAKGSSAEIRSMLYIAGDLGYLRVKNVEELSGLTVRVSQMLRKLIASQDK